MEQGRPIHAGVGIALVAYTSSFAVVLAGVRAVGATPAQATSALTALTVVMALGTVWLTGRHRMPISLAWSTPGAAALAVMHPPPAGWPAAVGAFLAVGALILITGLVPAAGRLVAAVPASLAQAMLAGVLLDICVAPLRGLSGRGWSIGAVALVWLVVARRWPRWAVTAAFVTLLVVVGLTVPPQHGLHGSLAPHLAWTTPRISGAALVGITLPLFIVTMTAQNVPGMAIMASYGFRVPWREAMSVTAIGTWLAAPFGGPAINLAAISASVPASAEAHPDPHRRWPASLAMAGTYLVLAAVTAPLVAYLADAPAALVGTIASLGLLGTLASSLGAALAAPEDRLAAVVTVVVAASGITVLGISGVFWALCLGLLVRWQTRSTA